MERRPNCCWSSPPPEASRLRLLALRADEDKERLEQALRLYKVVAARENAPSLFKAMSLTSRACLER
jgi:hypothetical protein